MPKCSVRTSGKTLLALVLHSESVEGFQLINELEVDGVIFRSLTSSVQAMGYQAGLVIAERKNGQGASFGYMLEKADQILTSQKWLHAMQEAYDLIETFRPHAPPRPSQMHWRLQFTTT